MIPARLGSTRVPKKNLRFLAGKPLLYWIVETARDSGLYDAVYVNTEADEIAELASRLGVEVYRRDPKLATGSVTSEQFVRDFIDRVYCDMIFQLTPTSPFVTADDMRRASELLENKLTQTVVSVRKIQAECVYPGAHRFEGVNFDPEHEMLPSQDLTPVHIFCNGIFGWKTKSFRQLQDSRGSATYGDFHNSTALLTLTGASTVDIDSEEDFQFAEAYANCRNTKVRFWSPTYHSQTDAADVLKDDGVKSDINLSPTGENLFTILRDMRESGARRIVDMPSSSATVISQQPGEGNRFHYHHDLDEWWLILEGEYEYKVGDEYHLVSIGDVISIPRNTWHQIRVVGSGRATRLAVSKPFVEHVYAE